MNYKVMFRKIFSVTLIILICICYFFIPTQQIIHAAGDTQAPTAPTNLISTSKTGTTVGLSWNTATDNVGVTGYDIYASGYTAQGSNLINNGGFESDLSGWSSLVLDSGNVATLSVDNTEKYSGSKSAKINITQLGTNVDNWTVEFKQLGATITAGKQYIVRFKAKSNATRTVKVWIGQNVSPWQSTGTWDNQWLDTNTQWKNFEGIFTATTTTASTDTRVSFLVGGLLDTVWIDDVEMYEATTLNNTLVGSSTGVTTTITGLSPNSIYNFTVKARDAANNVSVASNVLKISTDNTIVDTQAPTAPTNLTSISKTDTTATLSWSASTDNVGVTGYDVYNGTSLAGSTVTTTITISGLTPNTTYNFKVKAKDASGNISPDSNVLSVTTLSQVDTQAPTVPNNLSCTSKSSTIANLSWSPSTDNVGVTGYDIYASGYTAQGSNLINNGGFESDLSGWSSLVLDSGNVATLNVDTTEKYSGAKSAKINITQLGTNTQDWSVEFKQLGATITAGKQYIVRFKAKSNASRTIKVWIGQNLSPWQSTGTWDNQYLNTNTQWTSFEGIFTATTTTTSTNTRVSFLVGGLLDTVWIDDVEMYEATTLNNTLVGSSTGVSTTITGLSPNSIYNFTVKARDAANNVSAASNVLKISTDNTIVDTQAPTAPTNLVCSNFTDTTAILSWTAATDNVGVTAYDAYNGLSLAGSTASTTITITGLTPNTTYNFSVKAKDAAGNVSPASNLISVTTLAQIDSQAPTAPTNLASTSKTDTTVTLSWTAATDNVGVTGYDAYNGSILAGSTTSTTITITGLSPNTSYNFSVKAKDAAGNISNASPVLIVTTSAGNNSSLMVTCKKDDFCTIVLTSTNIDNFNGKIFNITYNTNELEVSDLCTFTMNNDISTGLIPGTDISITDNSSGNIKFTINKTIPPNNTWSGVLNCIRFKSKIDGQATITYSIL